MGTFSRPYGTGPCLESLPRTASWATLSRPLRDQIGEWDEFLELIGGGSTTSSSAQPTGLPSLRIAAGHATGRRRLGCEA